MGSMVLDSVLAMAGRWLGSLAAIFTSGPGLLVTLAVLATAYLYRKLSKKIADKIGIGLGPILALAVLAAVFFSLRGGLGRSSSPKQLREVLPPGLASAPAEEDQEATATAASDPGAIEKRPAATKLRAAVAANERAAVDDRIAGELAALTQGGLAPPQPPVLSLAPEIPPIQPPFIVAGAAVPAASQARPAAAPEATHAAATTPGGTKPGTTKPAAPPGKPSTAAASHGVGSPMPAATKGGYGARNGGLMGSRAAGGNVGTPGHHVKPRHYSGMGVPTMTYSQMMALQRQQAGAAMGNTPQTGMNTRNQAGNRGGGNLPLGGYGARSGGRMTGQPFGGMTPGYGNGTGMGGGSPYPTPNPGPMNGMGPMGGYGGMTGGRQTGLWNGEPMGGLFHPTEGGRLGMPFHPGGSNAMNGGPPGGGSGPMTGSPMGGMGMGGFGGMTGGPMGGMGHVAGSVGGGHR